jgi:transposase
MKEPITFYVGLDIHKDSIAIAIAQAGRDAPQFVGSTAANLAQVCKVLTRQKCKPSRTLVVYEAGPCGYGWARHLNAHGWHCEVISPEHIARSAVGRAIKTDRRDALLLARESRAGNLMQIILPDCRDEAIRDLSRAREDAIAARLRARQQLKAMMLRHGRSYHSNAWTPAHERQLASVRFDHPAQQIAFNEYRQTVTEAQERCERVTQALREQCAEWRMRPVVEALMCLRGFDFIAAITVIAELGDLTRFAHPRALMSYLGLVPSEHSSGNTRHQGSITRMGNKHVRRILVESAWTYRFTAHVGREQQIRQQHQPKLVRDIAWKAQLRLTQRYRKLNLGRKMKANKVCVAVARELCGFIWDLARHVPVHP